MTQMKRHLVATACILTWLFSQASQAGESTIGNGGDVLVCPSGVMMLDAYEATKNGYPLDLGSNTLTLEEKRDIVLRRLDNSLSPTYDVKKFIIESFNELLADYRLYLQNPGQPVRGKVVNFTNEDLMDIPDAGRGGFPAGCSVKQIAIQKKPQRFTELKYDIDIKLLAQLDADNLIMLFTHETMWGLRNEDISSSEIIRFAVGQLSSNLLDAPNVLDKGLLAHGLNMNWKNNSLILYPPYYINQKYYILNPSIPEEIEQSVSIQGTTYKLEYCHNGRCLNRVSLFETGAPARYDLLGKYHFLIGGKNYQGITDFTARNYVQVFSVYLDEQGQIYNLVETILEPGDYGGNYAGKLKKLFYSNGALAVSTSEKIPPLKIFNSLAVLDTNGTPIPPIQDIETNINANGIGFFSKPEYRGAQLIIRHKVYGETNFFLNNVCKHIGSTTQKFLMAYHADTETITIASGTTYAYFDGADGAFKIETAKESIEASQVNNFVCLGSDFKNLVAVSPEY